MMLTIVGISTVVGAVALPAQYKLTKDLVSENIESSRNTTDKELEVILQEPIYVYDKSLVQNILDAYVKKASISSIVVKDQNGSVLGKVNDSIAEETHTIPVLWDGKDIGVVEVGFNSKKEEAELASLAKTSFAIIFLIAVANLVLCSLAFDRRVILPLKEMSEKMKDIAEGGGDLRSRVSVKGSGEAAHLAKEFNNFIETVQKIVLDTKGSSSQLEAHGIQIDNLRGDLDRSTSEQVQISSDSIEYVEQFSAATHQINTSMESTMSEASAALTLARKGEGSMNSNTHDIARLTESLEKASDCATSLRESSTDIGKVIEVIKVIAEQTNLLALNAAIEAARAGESGRGFAVVADEVRALASKTHESTSEIETIIAKLQTEADASYSATELSMTLVDSAKSSSSEVREALGEITASIESINGLVGSVAEACEDQSSVSDSVSYKINSLGDTSSHLMDVNDKLQSLSKDISSETRILSEHVSKFKC